MISLETISGIVARVLEKDEFVLVQPHDRFEDLGIDSLGLLMVIVGVAQECNIDGSEDDIVHLVERIETVQDILDYVKHYSS